MDSNTVGNDGPKVFALDSGERRLNELGYKQELKRELGGFVNFAFGFSTISVLMGLTGLYGYGFSYGGPVTIIWGWVMDAFFTCLVAASLAEICSGYPTAGGLYFWSYELAGPEWGPFAAWVTAWFNLMGQVAGLATVVMICSQLIVEMILLSTGTNVGGGYVPTTGVLMCIFAAVLVLCILFNIGGVGPLAYLEYFSVFWHVIGTVLIVILLPLVAPTTQPASFVFTQYIPSQSGVSGSFYVFLLGLLMSQFTLAGYDTCAHVSEETKGADKSAGWGLFLAVFISSWIGLAYLLALTFSIQDVNTISDPNNETGGYTAIQIFYDAFMSRYNSPLGAILMTSIPTVAAFFAGVSTLTAASRVMYAMNRDKAFPVIWRALRYVHPTLKTPLVSVLFTSLISLGFAMSMFGGNTVFLAVTSVSVIGFYVSYAIPIFLRLTMGRHRFVPGPFNLGRYTYLVGSVAITFNIFITVVMLLPTQYPITKTSLNYAPVAFGAVACIALGGWVLGARTYFKGPAKNFVADENTLEKEMEMQKEMAM